VSVIIIKIQIYKPPLPKGRGTACGGGIRKCRIHVENRSAVFFHNAHQVCISRYKVTFHRIETCGFNPYNLPYSYTGKADAYRLAEHNTVLAAYYSIAYEYRRKKQYRYLYYCFLILQFSSALP